MNAAERPVPVRDQNGPRSSASAEKSRPQGSWPELVPLDQLAELPPFPVQALPSVLAEWSRSVATALQVPVDLPGLLALSAVSVACAKRYEVSVKPGWTEPLNLYVAVAMEPGERKSAAFRKATAPIHSYEQKEAKRLAPVIAAAVAKREVMQEAYKLALKGAGKKSHDAALCQRVQELAVALDATRLPSSPRYIADDTTPEKLGVLVAANGGRMGLFSSEGGIFETLSGRYSDGVVNLDLLLKAHCGDPFRVDRIQRETIIVTAPALTIALTVQPSVISGLAMRPELRGRGALARFIYSLPRSRVGHREQDPAPVAAPLEAAYERLILGLLTGPTDRDEAGEIQPVRLTLSEDARALLLDAGARWEPRLAPGADLEPLRDWAMKHQGTMARVAGLLHLASANASNSSIASDEVERALSLSPYLVAHARAAFQLMGADPNVAGARVIAAWLRREHVQRFTKRDAHRALQGTLRSAEALDRPLAILEDHAFIRQEAAQDREGPGRRPSPGYEVSPRCHEGQNGQNGQNGQTGAGR